MAPNLVERLVALNPVVAEICKAAGTPGASLGVLYDGEIVYTHHYGFRDVSRQLAPDDETIYYLGSLSKAFTTAAIGLLVEKDQIHWDSKMSKVLPEFRHEDPNVTEEATVADFLSHRTGLAPKNALWLQELGRLAIKRQDFVKTCEYLESLYKPRSKFMYSNWGFCLAKEVIERHSRQDWGVFLKENLFKVLGMERTVTHGPLEKGNIAEGYFALADGTPYHVPRPDIKDGDPIQGAAGVQSSVVDLLRLYKSFIYAFNRQESSGDTSCPNSPFKQVNTLTKAHINLSSNVPKRSFALGWIRTELPDQLGSVGLNEMYIEEMPLAGKGIEIPRLIFHHQGSLPAFLTSVYLIPDCKAAVVVLTNCMARCDTADWLGQMLLEAVIDNPIKNDYLSLTKSSVEVSMELWTKLHDDLDKRQRHGTPVMPLSSYIGSYYNKVHTWRMEILEKEGSLFMCIQGRRSQLYQLRHYHDDVFCWALTRDEDAHRAMFPYTFADFYLLHFEKGKSGRIDSVTWSHDPWVIGGERFEQIDTDRYQTAPQAQVHEEPEPTMGAW